MSFSFFTKAEIAESSLSKEVVANDILEALCKSQGVLSLAVSAGAATLSEANSQYKFIALTGALGGGADLTMHANVTKVTMFQNLTTGGQTVRVKMTGGTFFTIPFNSVCVLLSGTDAIILQSGTAALALTKTAAAGTSEELARVDHQHPRDHVTLCFNTGTITWTNMPAILTEFLGLTDRRAKYDLTNFTEARIIVNVEVVGAATAVLYPEWSTTDGGTYAALDNVTGPSASLAALGTIVSSWVSLIAGAKADVFLRISGLLGDGATDPQVGNVYVQFR
jgi:hypothetical protein